MKSWILDINIVDKREEDNYTVNNSIMLEGLSIIQATNIIEAMQKHAKIQKHEELNYILAFEEKEIE